ncbi:MAG: tetratricopeptide repeat protein [Armatimonadetes bacterium]|nr:tetratricopeptide repeat protein [Armatimonadota bacterium]
MATNPILTYVMTDVVGSTQLWEKYPEAMGKCILRHEEIAAEIIGDHKGEIVRSMGEGDSLFAVFSHAQNAVAAAAKFVLALQEEPWPVDPPICVRVGINSGPSELRDSDYFGTTINRTARIRAVAHGGQILVSRVAAALCEQDLPLGVSLTEIGKVRLKDLKEPEMLFQVQADGLMTNFPAIAGLDRYHHNLPVGSSEFIGRREVLDQLIARLASASSLIITGPAGIGKTRLALQAAAEMLEKLPGGAWYVPLGDAQLDAAVADVVAQRIGLVATTANSHDQVVASLSKAPALLILDGADMKLAESSAFATAATAGAPDLRVIITSRTIANRSQEAVLRLGSMKVPDPDESESAILATESVALFRERAAWSGADLSALDDDPRQLADLCRALDGIPLGIELAATRTSTLSVRQILTKIVSTKDQLQILNVPGSVDSTHTLEAALRWSMNQLNEGDRILLGLISNFPGGWTLQTFENLCSEAANLVGQVDALDILTRLVNASLVTVEHPPSQIVRYRLLGPIRAFSLHSLRRAEHLEFGERFGESTLRGIIDEALKHLFTSGYNEALSRLVDERANLEDWLDRLEALDEFDRALNIACDLTPMWDASSDFFRGAERLSNLLELAYEPSDQTRARALTGLGQLEWRLGNLESARDHLIEGECLYSEHSADRRAACLSLLCMVYTDLGQFELAKEAIEKSLALWRSVRNRMGEARSLNNLARLAWNQGNFADAELAWTQCVRLRRALHDIKGLTEPLTNLALIDMNMGRYQDALPKFTEAASSFAEAGSVVSQAISLYNKGFCYYKLGSYPDAEEAFSTSRSLALRCRNAMLEMEASIMLAETALADSRASEARRYLDSRHMIAVTPTAAQDFKTEVLLAELALLESNTDGFEKHLGKANTLKEVCGLPESDDFFQKFLKLCASNNAG